MPYGKKYFILDAIMPAFVSRKCLSVQLLTLFPPRCRRNNPANIRMQEKRRLARHHQHKASLVEEELRLDNAVITYAQPTLPPAMPPPPESPSLPPPPEANRAVRRLGIGDQQSAESRFVDIDVFLVTTISNTVTSISRLLYSIISKKTLIS